MNKLIVFITLIIFQAVGLAWGASYLLHLKNGNELRTPHYWEEGDEIKLYIYGGVAGIQKGFVTRVITTNVNGKENKTDGEGGGKRQDPLVSSEQKPREDAQIRSRETESKPDRSDENGELIDIDYYRNRKAALKGKFENALRKNEEAKLRRDQEATALTRKEYLEFAKQIIELGDELKRKNKGVLPDWWEE